MLIVKSIELKIRELHIRCAIFSYLSFLGKDIGILEGFV